MAKSGDLLIALGVSGSGGGAIPYSSFQPYKWFCDMPNWALISRADLPLLNHSATASRLNVASYFRRGLMGAAKLAACFTSFMTLAFQFSPLAGVRQIEATSVGGFFRGNFFMAN